MNTDRDAIQTFLASYFPNSSIFNDRGVLSSVEMRLVDGVLADVKSRFSGMKYILGLALDFVLLAQQASAYDHRFKLTQSELTYEEIFKVFALVEKRGERAANTLSFRMPDGKQFGIRKIEEQVVDFFHGLHRSAYPSAYVYNTGQWRKFNELLLSCFKLGSVARSILAVELIDFGLGAMTQNSFWVRAERRPRVFDEIVTHYERAHSGQNGGLILQALVFGFFKADRPHLNFVVDKVRTGSSRQNRFGDIDGYFGADLELTCEVKDLTINSSNLDRQCGAFLKSCQSYGILGIVVCEDVEQNAREEIQQAGCLPLSLHQIRSLVAFWDWPKQDAAFCACLHYISHVEQDADAALRMLRYVRDIDRSHSMLAYLTE